MSDRAFAYVDSSGTRRLPIHDASHVRNALARFGRVRFESDAAREQARARLLQAARRFRIVPVGFIVNEIDAATRAATNRATLPSGFVTMLMTDVEGSTGLVQELGGTGFGRLIDELWAVLRDTITNASGIEVEARADEFFAVFESPRSAIDAAVALQRTLGDRSFVGGASVRVRVGLHGGYPTSTSDNYVGLDVNVTSRITALGHGGQIVASANAREAVNSTTGGRVRFVALGSHRLRGVSEAVPLFQVSSPGLASKFPPLRT